MRILLSLLVVLATSGCFPVERDIYRPEAEGGRLLETSCNYSQGPGRWDKIEISQKKIKIQMQVYDVVQGWKLSVTLIVPEGERAQLATASLKLVGADKERSMPLEEMVFYELGGKEAAPTRASATAVMVGASYQGKFRIYDKHYSFYVPLPVDIYNTPFTVELPQVLVNNRLISFQKVKFVPAKATYFAGYC